MKICKLFPHQLFNITDQSLIRDVYLKYLQPKLTHEHYASNIGWLSRLGLPCYGYLSQFVSQLLNNRNPSNSLKSSCLSDIDMCNTLFVVCRKIMGISAVHLLNNSNNHNNNHIDNRNEQKFIENVSTILHSMPLVRYMR